MTITEDKVTDYQEISMFSVDGLRAAQQWGTPEAFKLFEDQGIEEVIEIGTCRGGFALMLRMVFPDAEIFTFDPERWEPQELKAQLFRQYQIHYFKEDVFTSGRLTNLITNKKRSLILCDGAHKGNEFTFFAPPLNSGSFIGGHDYFKEGRCDYDIWTTCELNYEMIENTVIDYQLLEFQSEVFSKVAWAMFRTG